MLLGLKLMFSQTQRILINSRKSTWTIVPKQIRCILPQLPGPMRLRLPTFPDPGPLLLNYWYLKKCFSPKLNLVLFSASTLPGQEATDRSTDS